MRLLSIDFDYFIDADSDTRNNLFPDGEDFMNPSKLRDLWNNHYASYPSLAYVGVIPEINLIKTYLKDVTFSEILIARSHKEIARLFENIPKHEMIEVVNIDHHHDMYHFYTPGEYYNCSNWLRRLYEDRDNVKIRWVKNEDSQIESLAGKFEHYMTDDLKEVLKEGYDKLFICFSPEWTPPHLEVEFLSLVECAKTGDYLYE